MKLRFAALATTGALLCAGAALAQPAPQGGPYDQASPQGYYQQMPARPAYRHHHHGVMAIIREEMRAGRLSQKEGTLIAQKVKQMHADRRAEREAREGAPPQQMQQPR